MIHQAENVAHHLLRFHFYRSSSASKFQAVTRDSVTQRERDEGRHRRGVPVPRLTNRAQNLATTLIRGRSRPDRGSPTCFEENHARLASPTVTVDGVPCLEKKTPQLYLHKPFPSAVSGCQIAQVTEQKAGSPSPTNKVVAA